MKKIRYRLVYNRKKLLNNQGTALIQVEASLGKHKIYFGTRIYIRPEEWDRRTSSVIGHPNADDLNLWLYEFIVRLEELELSMWKRGITPTLLLMKNAFENHHTQDDTFKSFCISSIQKGQRKKSTQSNLLTTIHVINDFKSTCTWEDLNYSFIKDFEYWLSQKGYAVNTVAKHLRNLRTFINEAIAAGYLSVDANPFSQYSIKQEKTRHRFLTPDELESMEKVCLDGTLAHVRDMFLFCCYTGLRFSDFISLRSHHLTEQKGNVWLKIKTEKTGCHVQIPLYLIFEGKALRILERYSSIETFTQMGSNAYVNRKLADLQQKLRITTKITFHVARHTCATLLCHQGVPITTVQKILGHSNLETTQVYSEVMADTIVRDLLKCK